MALSRECLKQLFNQFQHNLGGQFKTVSAFHWSQKAFKVLVVIEKAAMIRDGVAW